MSEGSRASPVRDCIYRGSTSAVTSMDYSPLRRKLRWLIGGLTGHATHDRLPELCEQLGMPSPDAGVWGAMEQ